jgi:hypothetical protein
MKYLLYILIPFVAPISYIFRKYAQKKKGFLWCFLSDNNMDGDITWRPKLKNKFFRAYFWMLRNPLQNLYWKDFVDGIEVDFHGTLKYKLKGYIKVWRTMICSDTGDWHGKVLDFDKSLFGVQNITFVRINIKGERHKEFRKSRCIPFRFLWWIILVKNRSDMKTA